MFPAPNGRVAFTGLSRIPESIFCIILSGGNSVNFYGDDREEPASADAVGCDKANEWFEGAGNAVFDACGDVVFDRSMPVNFGGDDREEPASAGAVGCDEANE